MASLPPIISSFFHFFKNQWAPGKNEFLLGDTVFNHVLPIYLKVIYLALRYPQSLVFILYHQGPNNKAAGREGRWDQIPLQNPNLLLGNNPVGKLPQNLVFVIVDWDMKGNQVQVREMKITGINRGS